MKTQEEIMQVCEALSEEIDSIVATDNTDLSNAEHVDLIERLATLTGKLEILLWVTE